MTARQYVELLEEYDWFGCFSLGQLSFLLRSNFATMDGKENYWKAERVVKVQRDGLKSNDAENLASTKQVSN